MSACVFIIHREGVRVLWRTILQSISCRDLRLLLFCSCSPLSSSAPVHKHYHEQCNPSNPIKLQSGPASELESSVRIIMCRGFIGRILSFHKSMPKLVGVLKISVCFPCTEKFSFRAFSFCKIKTPKFCYKLNVNDGVLSGVHVTVLRYCQLYQKLVVSLLEQSSNYTQFNEFLGCQRSRNTNYSKIKGGLNISKPIEPRFIVLIILNLAYVFNNIRPSKQRCRCVDDEKKTAMIRKNCNSMAKEKCTPTDQLLLPLPFFIHFLLRRDQNHHSNWTSKITKNL